jgi:hypothetical protein
MTTLIECSTCGYPLLPEEREGLVEIDGKMCKPSTPLTDEEIGKIAIKSQDGISPHDDTLRFAREIERAHSIRSEK